MTNFHIDATNLHWLEGMDERHDHCLHGDAAARIGERTLAYDECTVSSTALYLLKSLTEDHMIYQDNQMLPCCGHLIVPADDGENVHVCGCPNGMDWTVRHIEGAVELILEDGYTVTVPINEYRREVLAFVQKIEDFYHRSLPKELDALCLETEAYPRFWKEWHRRKSEATVYGAIDGKSLRWYTHLRDLLPALEPVFGSHNWLVTDCYCNKDNPIWDAEDRDGYCWLTGRELVEFAKIDNTQFIGAVFSGFPPEVTLEQVLQQKELPFWESPGFWQEPLGLQHPLANVEIVPWDSGLLLVLSRDPAITDQFRAHFPKSEDLVDHIRSYEEG